jgi:hypothetical protein
LQQHTPQVRRGRKDPAEQLPVAPCHIDHDRSAEKSTSSATPPNMDALAAIARSNSPANSGRLAK